MKKKIHNNIVKIDKESLRKKLNKTTNNIELANDNVEINATLENLIISLLDSEFSSIWFYDEENEKLLREKFNGVKEISLTKREGLLYKCLTTQKHGIYNYLTSEKDYVASVDNPDSIKIKSTIILPLIENGNTVGIVTAYSSVKKIKVFTEEDLAYLTATASYIINILHKIYPKKAREEKAKPKNRKESFDKTDELEEARREKKASDETLAFMSNTVHDIRTPANTLFNFLDLLEEEIADPKLKQYLLNAKESASFINELTTSILNKISSQRERKSSKKEKIDSISFFSTVTEMFSANMSSKGLSYNIFIDPLMPKEIITEPLKLKRIIMNLLNNAYKFTKENHSISFSIKYDQTMKQFTIAVKDTGIGIAKEKQKEIFDVFKQADDTTVLNYGGTGLGLAISSTYAKDLGGFFKLESDIGKGSEFSFEIVVESENEEVSFPLVENREIKIAILMDAKNKFTASNIAKYITRMGIDKGQIVATTSTTNHLNDITHLIAFQNKINGSIVADIANNNIKCMVVEESLFSLSKEDYLNGCEVISQFSSYVKELHSFINVKTAPKVLIVDDDRINCSLIETLLDKEFCKVTSSSDSEKALEMLIDAQKNSRPFSLIYIDNHMPGMNGNMVIRKFREYEKRKNLKPIYVVSISGDVVKNEADKRLFDLFLTKPFKKEDIREALYQLE